MAFLILKPASWFLSPRALHTVNVFLVRFTSLPQLSTITVYERYLKSGGKIRQTGKDFFRKLPEHIKQTPFLDALVGPSQSNIYDAILDVDVNEPDIFSEVGDEDEPMSGPNRSREKLASISSRSQPQEVSISFPSSSPTGARRRVSSHNRVLSATRTAANPTVIAPRLHTRSLSTSAQERREGEETYGAVALSHDFHLSIPRPELGTTPWSGILRREA